MSSDTLSDVLRAVRLKGAIFFSIHASYPWVIESPRSAVLAPHVMPGAQHVIAYHVVASGGCYAGLPEETGLGAGVRRYHRVPARRLPRSVECSQHAR